MQKTALLFIMCLFSCSVLFAQDATDSKEFSNPAISIGVVVADLQKSVDFYTNIIGMTKTGGFSVDGKKAKELGLTDGRKIDVTVLKLINNEQSTEWKLMSFAQKATHPKQKYMHDDNGIQYVTIFVKHLNPIIERIQKNKVKILSGTPSELGENRFFILVQDPDGTFIELIGPK